MRHFSLKEEHQIIDYIETIDFSCGYYKKNNNFECWIVDQKVTWDILNITCKCVLNLIDTKQKTDFRHQDFFEDEYSRSIYCNRSCSNGKAVLSNELNQKNTSKEYDKLFWNNFEFLSYIEVLTKIERKKYKIKRRDIIEKLASSQEACVAIICLSMNKLLYALPLKKSWENYINNKNKMNLEKFRNDFFDWMKKTTRHKKDIGQIWCKFINPLFFLYELKKFNPKKIEREWPQSWKDLAYLRIHPRDKQKPPGLTRKEYQSVKKENTYLLNGTINLSSAKNSIKKWNQQYYKIVDKSLYCSEYDGQMCSTIHIHHIWPQNEFGNWLDITSDIYENLIILTPNQHSGIAHNHGNTKLLNKNNLNLILRCKYNTIINFLNKQIGNYSKIRFYKLLCYIRNKKYMSDAEKNPERLESYIQDLITW